MDSRNVCSNNCNCDCNTDYLPPCPPCGDIPLPPPRPCPPVPGCTPNPPGCSNHTPNYGLPLWKASDVTSWLMQMNGAMLRIDTILHDLALRTGINGLPDDLVTTVSNLCQNYEVLKCTVSEMGNKQANLELLMQNLNTQLSAMKTDVSSMGISINNFDTRLMSMDSVTKALRNDIVLIKTDMNMLNKTLTNLSSTFTQFQQTVSQQLAEHEAAISELQNNPSGFVVQTIQLEDSFNGNAMSVDGTFYSTAMRDRKLGKTHICKVNTNTVKITPKSGNKNFLIVSDVGTLAGLKLHNFQNAIVPGYITPDGGDKIPVTFRISFSTESTTGNISKLTATLTNDLEQSTPFFVSALSAILMFEEE